MPESLWEGLKVVGALGLGGALGAVIKAIWKPSSKAEDKTAAAAETTAEAALVEAIQKATAAALKTTHAEISRLEKQAKADRSRHRRELDGALKRIRSLESDNELCRTDNADLRQQMQSLEEVLRRAGIPIPARDLPGTFVFMEGDRTTVMKAVGTTKPRGEK